MLEFVLRPFVLRRLLASTRLCSAFTLIKLCMLLGLLKLIVRHRLLRLLIPPMLLKLPRLIKLFKLLTLLMLLGCLGSLSCLGCLSCVLLELRADGTDVRRLQAYRVQPKTKLAHICRYQCAFWADKAHWLGDDTGHPGRLPGAALKLCERRR